MGASGAVGSGAQGISAIGNAYAQAQSIKAEAEYKQKVFEMNTQLAEYQADDALKRGTKEAAAQHRRGNQMVGEQRASLAAQGVEVDYGSAADVQRETEMMSKLDEISIKNNAFREAWGYKTQAVDYATRGQMAKLAGENEFRNTLVTGGTKALAYGAEAYSQYKKK
jgi:hypothetical protein